MVCGPWPLAVLVHETAILACRAARVAACVAGDPSSHAMAPLAPAIRVVALRVARLTRTHQEERRNAASSDEACAGDATTVAQLRHLRWRAREVARVARSVERTIASTTVGPSTHAPTVAAADALAGAAEELARLTLWVQTLRAPRCARHGARSALDHPASRAGTQAARPRGPASAWAEPPRHR
ncbi:MAG: hypothetical protein ACXWZS_00255 [Gemmatirosa sp.]